VDVIALTDGLLENAGLDRRALPAASGAGDPWELEATGPGSVLESAFAVTTATVALVGASTLGVAAAGRGWSPTGPNDSGRLVEVDSLAAAAAFQSERHLLVDGEPPTLWDPLAGHHRTTDGTWIQLHTNFDHHRSAVLDTLELAPDCTREQLAAALAVTDPIEITEQIVGAGGVAVPFLTEDDWLAHPAGAAVERSPLVRVERVADGPAPRPLDAGRPTPLAGLRVLDLTRIIAGPVAGRTLAAFGADVMRLGADALPTVATILPDSNMGKRFAHLDLGSAPGRDRMERLVSESDVVLIGARPGAMEALGFGPEQLHRLRPGLVVARLSAWGLHGPWAERRGFDSIVQTVSGIAHAGMLHAGAAGAGLDDSDAGLVPEALPCQLLDHGSGHLLALGATAALARSHAEPGGWNVEVALARTGRWLQSLGGPDRGPAVGLPSDDVALHSEHWQSDFGELRVTRSPGRLAGHDPRWERVSEPGGSSEAVW